MTLMHWHLPDMNKLIFTKLYVDGEEIARHELAEPIRDLIEATSLIFRGQQTQAVSHKITNTNSPAG
jgi:hypothetical protein